MSSHSLSTRRSFRHPSLRQPFSFLQVAAILWGAVVPGGAFGQIREERDMDAPPMDQRAEASNIAYHFRSTGFAAEELAERSVVEDGARYVVRQAPDGSLEVANLGSKSAASAALEGREAMATVCKRFPAAPAVLPMGLLGPLALGSAHAQLAPGRAVAPFDADQAREHQEAWAEHHDLPVETINDIGMVFVLIPPGEFTMGSPESDPAARTSEMPQRVVQVTQAFYLGKYPVTQEQWMAIMGRNPSFFKINGCNRPVESVAWVDCQEFLWRLNEMHESNEDRLFRLPTEAEWEYACRAGSTTRFSFGDEIDDLGCYAWHGENSGGRTWTVGMKRPNGWGLHDMHGNVWEWCYDWFDRFYYDDAPAEDPTGPDTGRRRVLRGGSWSHGGYPDYFRSAARYLGEPEHRRLNTDGFRAVWTIPPP